jgi:uracil-DNA glycosylase family 4
MKKIIDTVANTSLVCSCGKICIAPSGPTNAQILICGEYLGSEESAAGRPFVGCSGRILRAELDKIGVNLDDCRVTNLVNHEFPEEGCYQSGLEQVIREAKGRKAILLLGSECSRIFLGKGVLTISGLKVESKYLSAPIVRATINPAALLSGTVGEFRLALEKFSRALKKGKI